MRYRIILVSLIASVCATSAFAERASKEENLGIGLGATIGGVAGGPVGLVVGAALGAKFGDEYNERNDEIEDLSASLEGSRSQVKELQQEINLLGDDLQALQNVAKPELISLLQAGVEMDLLFRTDEDVLADGPGSRLQQLAASLATMSDVYVQLDGFADERGDADYNQGLSARRAEHVRDMLLASGVPAERLEVTAHGESPAADESADSYALERKVRLTLYLPENPSFASNPN